MADDSGNPDYFQHRWGVKAWDVGATTIPNPILVHYARVPWVDKDGKRGQGITNQEMLCIIHLASFHYESEQGESRPAIGTVARRMSYKKDDSVRGLIKSLEHKNFLTVERRPGKCSIYDFSNFSKAVLRMDKKHPPHPNGGPHSDGGHSNGPHFQGDEEEKISKEEKLKKEKKQKKDPPISPQKPQEADDAGTDGSTDTGGGDSAVTGGGDSAVTGLSADDHRASIGKVDYLGHCSQLAGRGPNYAVPLSAGGSFALGDRLITVACAYLGRSEPEGDKRKEALAFFEKGLKAEGLLRGDMAMLERAVKDWLDPEGEYAFFRSQYALTPKHDLALRHFGIVLSKAKAQAAATSTRRARDIEAMEESTAALDERRAARDPPPDDDAIGRQVKIALEPHMSPDAFRQHVKHSSFRCDDGALVIAAPDEFTRDWLENRTGRIIRGLLRGFPDGPERVEFEVDGGHNDPARGQPALLDS